VLALWLFRGRNSGYGQVMAKLADGLYHQRRGADLLAGQLDPDGWVNAGQGRRWRQPNISSLSRGRGKLGADPVRMLFEQVAGPAGAAGAPGVFCCGLRVVSMDGSVTDVPDSGENDAFFGRPSNQSRDGAFPQVRWVAAAESGTGSLLGAAMGPYRTAEQPLALDLLRCFGPGMVVLADRKFLSWSLARAFLATGAHILWRASASFTLKPVKVLPDGTYLAELKPPRKSDGAVLTVRVIEYTVHTAADNGTEETSEVFCLVTSLLDTEEYPALDLACCYPDRWGCETVIGHHKTRRAPSRLPPRPARARARHVPAEDPHARLLRPRPPRPGQPAENQESRRLPRPQARRAQRHQRHPQNRVPPAQPLANHLKARTLATRPRRPSGWWRSCSRVMPPRLPWQPRRPAAEFRRDRSSQIGERLFVAQDTVKTHVNSLSGRRGHPLGSRGCLPPAPEPRTHPKGLEARRG
jgi:hypothetical protein